ncbi:MAG: LysR family transcriptional regulator [bacterium 42_11]|jgi:DNA-binding transcriptional LysR family regulator|nr:MAG: LysR family transcriptional regulator [bacterium 42_11]
MDIEKLKTFYVMAKHQSFTKASEELFCSQPTVTKHIQEIENYVGCKLFDRIGKKVYLNENGKLFLEYAETVLNLTRDYLAKICEMESLGRGVLSFGATGSIGVYRVPYLLKKYLSKYPNIEINLYVNFYHKILEYVHSNVVDFALVADNGEVIESKSLVWLPFCTEELVLIIPPSHRWKDRERVDIEELEEECFIRSNKESATMSFIKKIITERGITIKKTIELGNIEAIKRAVETGLGVSIVPENTVEKEITSGWLIGLKLKNLELKRKLYYVQKKDKILSAAARAFVELLKELYPEFDLS